jgi:hypothetical protein
MQSGMFCAGVDGTVWGGEEWRIVKPRGSAAKVDACVALAMAVSVLLGERKKPELAVAFV